MTDPHTMAERLRIERAVWTLDARVQDLPRKSRIERRRELRLNLQAAAAEVGAREAIRQLGGLSTLARGYLIAEYGDISRRPSWLRVAGWIAAVDALMLVLGHTGEAAFRAGVTAASPHATGVWHWHGVPYLISDAAVTFHDGKADSVGGAWTPWVYVLMLGGAALAGRLWRLFPAARSRRSAPSAELDA